MAQQTVEAKAQSTTEIQNRTLWIGDLPQWIDENLLASAFYGTEVESVKVIRNKISKQSEGYGFIQFKQQEAAQQVLQNFNGQKIPGTEIMYRLNWASFGSGKGSVDTTEFSIFVGDLSQEINDQQLTEQFKQYYASVKTCKVVIDTASGRSKGFGFVKFSSEEERNRALTEMNGQLIGDKNIRVSIAVNRKSLPLTQSVRQSSDKDVTNTTIFVGGIGSDVNEEYLKQLFEKFGTLKYVKIPQGKGCAFIQFQEKKAAEQALATMNGQAVGNSTVRISWGRTNNKNAQQTQQVPTTTSQTYGYQQVLSQYPQYQYYDQYNMPYNNQQVGEAYGAQTYYDPTTQTYNYVQGQGQGQGQQAENSIQNGRQSAKGSPSHKIENGKSEKSTNVTNSYHQNRENVDPSDTEFNVDQLNSQYARMQLPQLLGRQFYARA